MTTNVTKTVVDIKFIMLHVKKENRLVVKYQKKRIKKKG